MDLGADFSGCVPADMPHPASAYDMYNANKPEPMDPNAPEEIANRVVDGAWCMITQQLGYFPEDVDACARACLDIVGCGYFAYDGNDGECFASAMPGSENNDDCPEGGFKSSNYFDMWRLNANFPGDMGPDLPVPVDGEPADPLPPVDGEPEVPLPEIEEPAPEVVAPAEPTMLRERERCNAAHYRFGFFRGEFEACAAACAEHATCQFVHYDPNDGECLRVETADETCPEGWADSYWYDFWMIPSAE